MNTQPTIEFAAIAAAIIGTLWASVPAVKPAQDGGHGVGGDLRTRGVVTATNLAHATAPSASSARGIERVESTRLGVLSSSRTEHHAATIYPPAWVKELGRRESNNMDSAIGDGGKAHGRYQFTRAAWDDTTKWRSKHGLSTYSFTNAHNEAIATQYVVSWFQLNRERYTAKHGHEPTIATLMEIHRRGLHGFERGGKDQAGSAGHRR